MALQNIDTRLSGASPYSGVLHPARIRPGFRVEFGAAAPAPRANLAQGIAKFSFLTGIAATILLSWQAITLNVQQFSVRPDTVAPVTTAVARWVHNWSAALHRQAPVAAPEDTTFAAESRMTARQLMDRWNPLIAQASARFDVPARWIRAVMQTESAGRTMSAAFRPTTSRTGAMGVMQLMPGTYREMRVQYHLGANAYDPHDNVFAGAAYLHWLSHKYGYPEMFAAYNDGPGHLEERLMRGGLLPAETRNYVSHIVTELGEGASAGMAALPGRSVVDFTRPNGSHVKIDLAEVTSVRVPLPGEYASAVKAVIAVGDVRQAVRESYDTVRNAMIAHGALGSPAPGELAERGPESTPRHSGAGRSSRHGGRRMVARRHTHRRGGEALADAGVIHLHQIGHRAKG